MKDFTLILYQNLLIELQLSGYTFLRFSDYANYNKKDNPNSISFLPKKIVILRHDVDRLVQNALTMAEFENSLNINSTYFFRIKKNQFNEKVIKYISNLKHEIGYHYEDMTLAKGDYRKAIQLFEENSSLLKKITDVSSLCMHGSPLSKWDNSLIWNVINYRDYGYTLEPYFDIDYEEFFYITDTGRIWNSSSVNFRDRVKTSFNIKIKHGADFIKLTKAQNLPNRIIINTHPHRWFNLGFMWYKEYIFQNVKNLIKIGMKIIRN